MADYPILELREVSKSFPGVQALEQANVSVLKGEVHALLGENGAGKSTMVNLIAGVYTPDEGELILDGENVRLRDPRDSLDKGIAIIPQERMLVPELSIAENIFLGRLPKRMYVAVGWPELQWQAKQLLKRVGLHSEPDTMVNQLPAGAQQQVEIARAIAMNPKLLIMDEPTSSLTKREVRTLFEIIRKLKEESLTVIFISHQLEEVWEIADRITVLRDGKVALTHATVEFSQSQAAEAMVGHEVGSSSRSKRSIAADQVLTIRGLNNSKLRDVNIEVHCGEIVGLAGILGSGRTELLRAIYGADSITTGEILIENAKVSIKTPVSAIRYGVFLVPEDRGQEGLLSGMSVADNVTLPYLDQLSNFGFTSRRGQANVVDRFVDRLKIRTPGRNQQVNNLSGGNQQKTVLARWLSMNPHILLLDEPTRGVDIGAKEEIYELMQELSESGVAIVFVATELPELLSTCDRIYAIRNGRVTQEFVASDCSEEELFLAASGGET